MITHDRYFLDSVCNRIVEVDKGQTYSYDTNYSGFLELKAAREESERASERKRQSILRKEIEWLVGSSNMNTSHGLSTTVASASLFLCPPESSPVFCAVSGVQSS